MFQPLSDVFWGRFCGVWHGIGTCVRVWALRLVPLDETKNSISDFEKSLRIRLGHDCLVSGGPTRVCIWARRSTCHTWSEFADTISHQNGEISINQNPNVERSNECNSIFVDFRFFQFSQPLTRVHINYPFHHIDNKSAQFFQNINTNWYWYQQSYWTKCIFTNPNNLAVLPWFNNV